MLSNRWKITVSQSTLNNSWCVWLEEYYDDNWFRTIRDYVCIKGFLSNPVCWFLSWELKIRFACWILRRKAEKIEQREMKNDVIGRQETLNEIIKKYN